MNKQEIKKQLVSEALKAKENAYAVYSSFKVGAAALFEDGKIYTGCNIENASYGATNCAERTAIFTGIAKGNRCLEALAVAGDTKSFTYPCGICRQVILEFAKNEDMVIYIVKNENEVLEIKLRDLFPGPFSKKDLGL